MLVDIGSLVGTLKIVDEASGVIGTIQAGVGGLTSIMGKMGGIMGDAGQVINSAFSGFATGGPAGAALGAGVAIIGELVNSLQTCVKEATASEAVWASLAAAVDRSGAAWDSVAEGTKKTLLAMQATTTYSDEQLAASLERMLTFGLSYDQAMKALGATIDFAAAKHMDLESAATLVGKALDGNTAIMKRYGVDIEVAKDATDKFTPVIAALNEQFGGAAQAAASTYAGIQERLKNATQEVGEKIGTILLPGLASLTEAMIPVVDSFGKGVDSIQAWLTEVAKMPEVKATTDALGQAFQSLGEWFAKAGTTVMEVLGPAITELMGSLGELFNALKPVFDAFKELWDAIVGGSGDFDAFKMIVENIALQIRGVVEILHIIIPIIKEFAAGFKAAADFIAPILTSMREGITTFLDAARAALEGFYAWFVGGSMWQEMWNAVISVATAATAKLITVFTDGLVKPITDILAAFGTTIQTSWTAAWSGLTEAFLGLTASIQSTVASIWGPLSAYLQGAFENWGAWADAALASIQTAINTGLENLDKALTDFMGAVEKGWSDFGQAFSGLIQGIADTVIGIVNTASSTLSGVLAGMVSAAQTAASTIAGILSGIGASISNALSGAANATAGAGADIVSGITGALDTVSNAATGFYNWLTGHSLWPDLMDSLVSQTEAGMAGVLQAFESGFGGITLAAPTVSGLAATRQAPASAGMPSSTFNNTTVVQVDGAIVARTVEKRLIQSRSLSAWR